MKDGRRTVKRREMSQKERWMMDFWGVGADGPKRPRKTDERERNSEE